MLDVVDRAEREQLIEAFLSIKYAFDRRPDWAMVGLVLDRAREPDIQILRDEISRATRGHMEFFTATLDPALKALGTFKADTINVRAYGENQVQAQELFDKAGWK